MGLQDAVLLARAVKEHERREGVKAGFSEAPGDCLAFKYFRDVRTPAAGSLHLIQTKTVRWQLHCLSEACTHGLYEPSSLHPMATCQACSPNICRPLKRRRRGQRSWQPWYVGIQLVKLHALGGAPLCSTSPKLCAMFTSVPSCLLPSAEGRLGRL
jgi:hypothetical protein